MLQSCTRRLVSSCVPPTCSPFATPAATTAPTTFTTIRNRTRCLATSTPASAKLYSNVHHGRRTARKASVNISSSSRTRKMATLSAFLEQARDRLRSVSHGQGKGGGGGGGGDNGEEGTVTFVVGNESADLDSLCSSLVLAYFKSQEALLSSQTRTSTSSPSSLPKGTLHIPLCHLPRADLGLRPEFAAVLRQAGLTPEELITLDDIPFPSSTAEEADRSNGSSPSLDPGLTRWVLVDHNVLTGRLAREFSPPSSGDRKGKVVGCIDHHDDEGKLPPVGAECEPRIIEKSGSCMSLVVEHCRGIWEEASAGASSSADKQAAPDQQQEKRRKLDDQIARLVLAPILIDTNDLRDANKTTEHDTQVVEWLEQTKLVRCREDDDDIGKGGAEGSGNKSRGFDRTAYFDHIQHLKNDISQMSLRDVLRKDYKEWTETSSSSSSTAPGDKAETTTTMIRLGTMSCSCRISYLLENTCQNDARAFIRGLQEWIAEKDLDVAAIMSAYEDEETGGGFKRDLFLWGVTTRGGGGDYKRNPSGKGVEAAERFVVNYNGQLKLMSWEDGRLDTKSAEEEGEESKHGFRRCWTQGTTKFSRKQVAPMLREAMRGVLG